MSEFSTSAKKHPYSSMRYSQTEFPSYYDNRRGNYGASYLAGGILFKYIKTQFSI